MLAGRQGGNENEKGTKDGDPHSQKSFWVKQTCNGIIAKQGPNIGGYAVIGKQVVGD